MQNLAHALFNFNVQAAFSVYRSRVIYLSKISTCMNIVESLECCGVDTSVGHDKIQYANIVICYIFSKKKEANQVNDHMAMYRCSVQNCTILL